MAVVWIVVWPFACTGVLRKVVRLILEKAKMAMEKKSLVSKKTATPTNSKNTKSKVDTSKPAASKVVAARANPRGAGGQNPA
jgi:hypothetical protein